MEPLYNAGLVVDCGTGRVRGGYATDDAPRQDVSNLCGREKYTRVLAEGPMGASGGPMGGPLGGPAGPTGSRGLLGGAYVGEAAQRHRGLLHLTRPMARGVVQDWAAMEALWEALVRDLAVQNLGEHPLLITEAPLNPRGNRVKMGEVLFESMGAGAVYVAAPAPLALYASARTTGCVLDSGAGVTTVTPIYNGFALPEGVRRLDLGGDDVTRALERNLYKEGYNLSKSSELEIVRSAKERLGRVRDNHSDEHRVRDFVLPDGKRIGVSDRSVLAATDVMFEPAPLGLDCGGAGRQLCEGLQQVETDLRGDLLGSLLLCGGNTMLRGFGKRLLAELSVEFPNGKLKMYAPKERKTTVFTGGSVLASLSTFRKLLVTRSEYLEDPDRIFG